MRKPYVLVPAVVAVAVAVGLGMGALGDGTTAASPTSQLATATRGPMTQTVSAEGTVAAAQTGNLQFGSSGTVTAVDVQAGDEVQAGQVLASVDSPQLRANVAAAESSVARAAAQLANDQSSGASAPRLAVDEADVAATNDQLANAQTALNGASLVATFDGVVSQVNVTVGEQLASSGSGATSATGSASGSGNSSASNGSSGSGAGGGSGTNTGRNGGSGANTGGSSSSANSSPSGSSSSNSSSPSSQPDVQVVSKNSYVVQLPVASADVNAMKVGQQATLTVTASSTSGAFPGGGRFGGGFFGGGAFSGAGGGNNGGQRANGGANGQRGSGQGSTGQRSGGQAVAGAASATGTVTDVAQVATASTGVAQYPVTVTFTAGSRQIFVGSTVTGAVDTNTRNDVLQVPVRAVTATNGASTVTVLHNGRDEPRTVKTGLTANGMVEITGGLKEGEQVVVRLPAGFRGQGSGSASSGQRLPTGAGPAGSSSGSGR
jgi:multidrug efflux pump subunit AcrA (membrane-fusion protein)